SDFRPPLLGPPEFPANFERFSCLSWAGAVLSRHSPRGRALAAGGSPPTPIFSGRPLFWCLVISGSSAERTDGSDDRSSIRALALGSGSPLILTFRGYFTPHL